MRIPDLLEHMCNYAYEIITIIVPNYIEKKLLCDRFHYNNIHFVAPNIAQHNNKTINIISVDEADSYWGTIIKSCCFVEFPESVPEYFVNKLRSSACEYNFTNELM